MRWGISRPGRLFTLLHSRPCPAVHYGVRRFSEVRRLGLQAWRLPVTLANQRTVDGAVGRLRGNAGSGPATLKDRDATLQADDRLTSELRQTVQLRDMVLNLISMADQTIERNHAAGLEVSA